MADNVTKYFVQRIETWLHEAMEKDELFRKTVESKPEKTVEGACNYVLSVAKQTKQQGWDDDEVYGLVRHFYDEDDIKDPGDQNPSRIVVSGHVDLTEEEKVEAMEAAKRMHAVRICTRNGVRINEADIFFDYIDLLEHFGKDTHNAHYVCPGDLRRAHDRLVMKKQAEDMKRELEEQMEAIGKEEPKYMDFRGKWFGMCFVVGYIAVSVLSSVRAFLEEGMAMKHCVFTNRYYDSSRHPNSLILSARDRNDNRLETVEVNTETWEIVQSRGFRNGTTRFHDEIIRIVEQNMNLLKSVA